MPTSIYDASVLVFRQMLECQMAFLHKAAAHADSKNIDPMRIAGARMSRNSPAYGEHVRSMCFIANKTMAQLANMQLSKSQIPERGIPGLKKRVARSLALAAKLKPENFAAAEDKMHPIPLSNGGVGQVTAQELLLHFAMPNFFVHAVLAYETLVQIGMSKKNGRIFIFAGGVRAVVSVARIWLCPVIESTIAMRTTMRLVGIFWQPLFWRVVVPKDGRGPSMRA